MNGAISSFLNALYTTNTEQTIEMLVLSLNNLFRTLNIRVNNSIYKNIHNKLSKYKNISINKKKMQRIIEVIISNINKENLSESTIVPMENEEFKSIIDENIEVIDKQSEDILPSKASYTPYTWNTPARSYKPAEDILAHKETTKTPDIFINDLNKYKYQAPSSGISNAVNDSMSMNVNSNLDKCNSVINKINEIINKKDKVPTECNINRIEKYENEFNHKVVNLLSELYGNLNADKPMHLDTPKPISQEKKEGSKIKQCIRYLIACGIGICIGLVLKTSLRETDIY
ncbi:hypothetical protein NEOKW01_0654 [Nematocida sp. AWRm80]|nr:hypothetical protein NEOKW01_0654 [Nematocida sp. AWRm80]